MLQQVAASYKESNADLATLWTAAMLGNLLAKLKYF